MNNWTRKDFLKTTLAGGGALMASRGLYGQAPAAGRAGSANGDIRVAVVGVNAQGRGHMLDYASKLKGARLVAICDVDSKVMAERKAQAEKAGESTGLKVATFVDYRKMLEDPNIDAVVLATPNHLHSLQTIWGLQAGKDVYVEKPLSHKCLGGSSGSRSRQEVHQEHCPGRHAKSLVGRYHGGDRLRSFRQAGQDPVGSGTLL